MIPWEYILPPIVSLIVGYVGDRWGYNRTIAKNVERITKTLPEGSTARQIAEQAVIEANLKEADKAVKKADKARVEHEIRMAAIKAGGGEVNVGSFKK